MAEFPCPICSGECQVSTDNKNLFRCIDCGHTIPAPKSKSKSSAEEKLFKNKLFSDSIKRANDKSLEVQLLPTGLIPLDVSLGGGLPRGRSAELIGDSGTAKTAVIYVFLVSIQKKGGLAAIIDPERAFDPEWFASLGGDPGELIYCEDTTLEGIGTFIFEFCKAVKEERKESKMDRLAGIGWDSIAHSTTKHLLAEGMDKVDMSFAKVLTAVYKYINGELSASKVILLSANQVRDRISKDPSDQYKGTFTSGGKMSVYSPSTRVELKIDGGESGSRILDGGDREDGVIGRSIRGSVIKSRCGAFGNSFKFPIYTKADHPHPLFSYTTKKGVDQIEALFDMYAAGKFKINNENVIVSGSWCRLHDSFGMKESFRKVEWADVLAKYPILWELPYQHLAKKVEEKDE